MKRGRDHGTYHTADASRLSQPQTRNSFTVPMSIPAAMLSQRPSATSSHNNATGKNKGARSASSSSSNAVWNPENMWARQQRSFGAHVHRMSHVRAIAHSASNAMSSERFRPLLPSRPALRAAVLQPTVTPFMRAALKLKAVLEPLRFFRVLWVQEQAARTVGAPPYYFGLAEEVHHTLDASEAPMRRGAEAMFNARNAHFGLGMRVGPAQLVASPNMPRTGDILVGSVSVESDSANAPANTAANTAANAPANANETGSGGGGGGIGGGSSGGGRGRRCGLRLTSWTSNAAPLRALKSMVMDGFDDDDAWMRRVLLQPQCEVAAALLKSGVTETTTWQEKDLKRQASHADDLYVLARVVLLRDFRPLLRALYKEECALQRYIQGAAVPPPQIGMTARAFVTAIVEQLDGVDVLAEFKSLAPPQKQDDESHPLAASAAPLATSEATYVATSVAHPISSYSADSPIYVPTSPVFASKSMSPPFISTSPAYISTSPAYIATSPAYAPKSPAYSPESSAYVPESAPVSMTASASWVLENSKNADREEYDPCQVVSFAQGHIQNPSVLALTPALLPAPAKTSTFVSGTARMRPELFSSAPCIAATVHSQSSANNLALAAHSHSHSHSDSVSVSGSGSLSVSVNTPTSAFTPSSTSLAQRLLAKATAAKQASWDILN